MKNTILAFIGLCFLSYCSRLLWDIRAMTNDIRTIESEIRDSNNISVCYQINNTYESAQDCINE